MKRKVLEGLNSAELVELLKKDPSIASKFDEYSLWSKIITWSYLLAEQPQFEDKCDEYGGWRKFETNHWSLLLDEQPQFEEKHDALN